VLTCASMPTYGMIEWKLQTAMYYQTHDDYMYSDIECKPPLKVQCPLSVVAYI
jgi:hypothetical protein